MSKEEFFQDLDIKLKRLPEEERKQIRKVYEDLFQKALENGKSEHEVAQSLGYQPKGGTAEKPPAEEPPTGSRRIIGFSRPSQDAARSGGASDGQPHSDAARSGGTSASQPHGDAARSGGTSAGQPHGDAARSGGASAGQPHGDAARSGGASAGQPHGDAARSGGASAGQPHGDAARFGGASAGQKPGAGWQSFRPGSEEPYPPEGRYEKAAAAPQENSWRPLLSALLLGFFNLVFVLAPVVAVAASLFAVTVVSIVLVFSPVFILLGTGIPQTIIILKLEVFGALFAFGVGLLLLLLVSRLNKWFLLGVKKYTRMNIRLIKGQ
ncbi:hypothetical protein J31TS4_42870 [Paenibacillus sp. J31TS4]|uniref:HAAS signaling domain-containing protein n=1 Tax=Paenibacillus sp. J31TS4 TaxID=2807195 RepID=UPI001B1DBBFF|nr:DUF1700 domain-containing protein [Paenibacillus sp. J31TS4]GIP41007.1 hypothetical protein J31TS4_42870 [Paenibacillus sp. J31TS4]